MSVDAAADIYAMSPLERAHDRLNTMLGTYEADPQLPVGFERLRWKIGSTL